MCVRRRVFVGSARVLVCCLFCFMDSFQNPQNNKNISNKSICIKNDVNHTISNYTQSQPICVLRFRCFLDSGFNPENQKTKTSKQLNKQPNKQNNDQHVVFVLERRAFMTKVSTARARESSATFPGSRNNNSVRERRAKVNTEHERETRSTRGGCQSRSPPLYQHHQNPRS
jgi:hypothetical protein